MDFVMDNYFWFIVGAVVILMIIIGYIAEQTDFGRKPFKEKKEKVKADKVVENKAEEDTVNVEMPIEELNTEVEPDQFMVETEIADVEASEDVATEFEDLAQPVEEDIQEVITDEIPNEEVKDETVNELDIPEIATEENDVSDIVEDITPEEDDVWKF